MLLHELLRRVEGRVGLEGIPNVQVTGVEEDSREVRAGDLFIARAGKRADGAKFVKQAADRGAVGVVAQSAVDGRGLPVIVVSDPAAAGSEMAHALAGDPSHWMRVLGVTGTNGKTTTAYLLRHLLTGAKAKCGMVGTVEVDDGRTRAEAKMTTPLGIELARLLGRMRDHGCRAAAMEVSSHALHQARTAGVRFAGAGFTNLTRDHLDYHLTMENYAAAKALLFEGLAEDAVAVMNERDEWTWRMERDCRAKVVKFGFSERSDYRAKDFKVSADGNHFILVTPDGEAEVHMALVGTHNIENALLAAGLACEVFGMSVHGVAAGLRDAPGAPGRLQPVRCGQPFSVFVDYAHTDDALKNVLGALRPLCRGKLRVLFGCGGERDLGKRPLMAQAAQELADAVYITSDNPRSENPDAIIEQICAGLTKGKGAEVFVESDRRKAIEMALADARSGDVVLLAGKGHENYQIVGDEHRHFDDVEEAARVLQSRAASF